MKKLLLVITLIAVSVGTGVAKQKPSGTKRAIAVAFFDEERLRDPAGQLAFENFEYFYKKIEEIVKRDFPDVELRILERGELLSLPDGTRLNVETMQPELGYVLAAPSKKRQILGGLRSDADFACAASAFFQRSSSACPK
jgi:hypothetical protein